MRGVAVAFVLLLAVPAWTAPGDSREAQAKPVRPLPAAGLAELADLLADCFDPAELEQVVRVSLSARLYVDYVPRGLTGRATARRLLEATERRGETVRLLAAVVAERPYRADLWSAVEKWCPRALEGITAARPRAAGAGEQEAGAGP